MGQEVPALEYPIGFQANSLMPLQKLSVVQWIERGPPKAEMQVRFLPGRPVWFDTWRLGGLLIKPHLGYEQQNKRSVLENLGLTKTHASTQDNNPRLF